MFVFANSVDTDEMAHYAASHLGLHCVPKYSFRNHWNTKGSRSCHGVMDKWLAL